MPLPGLPLVAPRKAIALNGPDSSIDENFDHLIALLQNIRGNVILTGIGKSGNITRESLPFC